MIFKGTVCVILSNPPCKDGNDRFPLNLYRINNGEDIDVFLALKLCNSYCS